MPMPPCIVGDDSSLHLFSCLILFPNIPSTRLYRTSLVSFRVCSSNPILCRYFSSWFMVVLHRWYNESGEVLLDFVCLLICSLISFIFVPRKWFLKFIPIGARCNWFSLSSEVALFRSSTRRPLYVIADKIAGNNDEKKTEMRRLLRTDICFSLLKSRVYAIRAPRMDIKGQMLLLRSLCL